MKNKDLAEMLMMSPEEEVKVWLTGSNFEWIYNVRGYFPDRYDTAKHFIVLKEDNAKTIRRTRR